MGSVRKCLQVVLLCIGLFAVAAHAQVESVDPTIGNIAILLAPTRPTVYLPNSMVRVYPVRDDGAADQIQFFPLTINGHRGAELFSIMLGDGSPAAYDQEITTPYYYSTRFNELGASVEFTATERCGFFRFAFADQHAKLVLSNLTTGNIRVRDGNIVEGEERFDGMAAYVYGVFSKPVQSSAEEHGKAPQVLVSADAGPLEFRYGISFISTDQAKHNLKHEVGSRSFEQVKDAAKARWNNTLGRIIVEGGTESQRRVFYTALYRSSERMINITEDGRYYSGFDHRVHTDARPFYVDNWLWDTYRALEPLQTLLHPNMEADKLQSYVRMYQQGGIMPTFNEVTGPVACMNGNHSAPWFADAWFKGVRNFDLATAY